MAVMRGSSEERQDLTRTVGFMQRAWIYGLNQRMWKGLGATKTRMADNAVEFQRIGNATGQYLDGDGYLERG